MAIMLPYEIPSVAADPVFGLGLPFASRLALIVQYPVANELVDLPYLGFGLVADLFLVLPLVVPVLLLVHLHPLAVLVVLVVGLVPVPLRLLVQVQVVARKLGGPGLTGRFVVLVDELPGELH